HRVDGRGPQARRRAGRRGVPGEAVRDRGFDREAEKAAEGGVSAGAVSSPPVQMAKDDDRAREEFTSEAEELLDTLSRDLVEFESQGKDVRPEVINKIFREVHSLKGLAGMLGFGEISELSHSLEDMLDRLRMGKIEITKD